MIFRERLAMAQAHESVVMEQLRELGWLAEPFGQALLSEEMRDMLRRTSSPVRWMPDIIAARWVRSADGDRVIVAFIDAKAGDRYKDTGNHALEVDAVMAADAWIRFAGCCDVFFVFDDAGVLTPRDVVEFGSYHSGRNTRGSGTPFMLVQVTKCRHIDDVFKEGTP